MLAAEAQALEQHGLTELLRILDQEFNYYVESYKTVGTQAALIAGFAVAVLVTLDTSDDARRSNDLPQLPRTVVETYHVLSVVTLMSLLYCIIATTCVSVWAPQLALRGASPSAMDVAVRGIKDERHPIYTSFLIGIVSFTLMVVSVAWIQMNITIATLCSGLSLLMLILIFRNGLMMKSVFSVDLTDPRVSQNTSFASGVDGFSPSQQGQQQQQGRPSFRPSTRSDGSVLAPSAPSHNGNGNGNGNGNAGGEGSVGGSFDFRGSSSVGVHYYPSPSRGDAGGVPPPRPASSSSSFFNFFFGFGRGSRSQSQQQLQQHEQYLQQQQQHHHHHDHHHRKRRSAGPSQQPLLQDDHQQQPSLSSFRGSATSTAHSVASATGGHSSAVPPSPGNFFLGSQGGAGGANQHLPVGARASSASASAAAAAGLTVTRFSGDGSHSGNGIGSSSTQSSAVLGASSGLTAVDERGVVAAEHQAHQAGGGGAMQCDSEEVGLITDALATRLVRSGGGWLSKRSGNGGGSSYYRKEGLSGGWKRRWVAVRGGTLFYSKQPPPMAASSSSSLSSNAVDSSPTRPPEGAVQHVDGAPSNDDPGLAPAAGGAAPNEKSIALERLVIQVGADGLSIRLAAEAPPAGPEVGGAPGLTRADFKCDSTEQRNAWVAYIKAGINAANEAAAQLR
jgi:hypothetical protein